MLDQSAATFGPVTYEECPPKGVQFHEYANLFPMIQGDALAELTADIRANGVEEPIVFIGRQILDGRNRYMAARELGIAYPRREYLGDNPLAFVISKNVHRRHLSESQRAMVASKLANMTKSDAGRIGAEAQGKASANLHLPHVSTADAGAMLNVSVRSVKSAKKVRDKGDESLVKDVEAGKVSVSKAAKIADLPKPEQAKAVAAAKVKAPKPPKPADPYGFAAMTRDGLIEEATGLRDEVEELRKKIAERDATIALLKAQIDDLSQADLGLVVGRMHRENASIKLARDEAMATVKRMEYRLKKAAQC